MKIYISYSETQTGGEKLDPNDRWSSRTKTIRDYRLRQACLVRPENDWYVHEFDLKCKEAPEDIYTVVVRYASGDSFGTSTGNGCVEGVYLTKKEAMKVAKDIEDDTYKSKNRTGHCQWNGYFERFESVETYVMRLRKTPKDKDPIRID